MSLRWQSLDSTAKNGTVTATESPAIVARGFGFAAQRLLDWSVGNGGIPCAVESSIQGNGSCFWVVPSLMSQTPNRDTEGITF